MNTSGRGVLIRQTLAVGGPNPEMTPRLTNCSFSVYSAAAATKTDFVDIDNDQTSLGTGTLSNATSYSDGLYTTGSYRNWDDLSFASQTLYGVSGAGNPQQGESQRYFFLRTDSGLDVRSRFDFAGTWQNFIMEIDIHLLSGTNHPEYGVVYRTTGWQNANDTYAYVADITDISVNLRRGTNTGSGGGAFTSVATVALTLTVGNWYRMKVVVNGSNHQVYLNDVLYINATDATWSAAGSVGVRLYNNTGARSSGHYDNFGIVGYESDLISVSSRTTSAIALSGIVGDSRVNWQESTPSSSTMLVESTLNNGTLWEACTNGGQIPQLVSGYNAAGKSLKFRFSMTNQAVNLPTKLLGYSAFVIGQYSASGTRVSPVLALDNAGTIGSSSVTWQATQPAGTGVAVATSPDNSTYTTVSASGNPVAGLVAQGALYADDFDVNSAGSYTSTFIAGGAAATWTYDTANSRLSASGGTNGVFRYDGISVADATAGCIIDQAISAGLVVRMVDASNAYMLFMWDSANGNTAQVWKIVAGTWTQLGSSFALSFTRGTYHRFVFSAIGSTLTVIMDGIQIFTTTDTGITAAGKCGLLNGSASSGRFYSLSILPMGASATGKNVYSKLTLTSTDPTVKPVVSGLVVSVRGPDIMTGALIASTQYAYKKISDNLNDAAGQSKYNWRIDKNKKLAMKDRAYSPAAWPLYSADPTFKGILNPPNLVRTSPLYRNRQYVTGAIDLQTITESKIGDGTTESWVLKYPVDSITSLTLDGNPQTSGVQGVDTSRAFYYQPGQNSLSQDSSQTPPTDQQLIAITYIARVPYTSMRESASQQAALALIDGTSGIIEGSEDCGGRSKAEADTIAQARIDQYAILSVDWSYQTERSGLAPGNLQSIFVPEFGQVDVDVLITAIKTSIWADVSGALNYLFDVSTTSGPNIGSWQRIFAQAA